MIKNTGINNDSRTLNSLKNIGSGVIAQVLQTILGFVSRTVFIKYLAVEYLGINGLFASILSVLALAELGIGSAFVYSLYKPLADKNEVVVASIINFYKRVYIIIGFSVFLLGIVMLPFLDQIIPEKPDNVVENISLIYLFFLFNAASTYFFSYKVSLLNADQRNYVTTINYSLFYIVQNAAQIIVLVIYKDFILYLTTQLVMQFLSNLSISIVVNKYYPFLSKFKKTKIDKKIKDEIFSNTKATLIYKIGGIIVNNTDNLIINYFSGLVLVGLASNYSLLLGIVSALILQIYSNIIGSIAQVNAKETKEKQYEIFNFVNFSNLWIYGVSSIGFVILTNDFIILWIGKDFVLPASISLVLAINFFMVGVQSVIWNFKATYGFFHQGKYLVMVTAFLNILFSFLLGSYYGLLGILAATAISRVLTNFHYDPYIVFKLGLKVSPLIYFKKLLSFVIILIISGSLTYYVSNLIAFTPYLNIVFKLIICLIIPNIAIIMFYRKTDEFQKIKELTNNFIQSIKLKFTAR